MQTYINVFKFSAKDSYFLREGLDKSVAIFITAFSLN